MPTRCVVRYIADRALAAIRHPVRPKQQDGIGPDRTAPVLSHLPRLDSTLVPTRGTAVKDEAVEEPTGPMLGHLMQIPQFDLV